MQIYKKLLGFIFGIIIVIGIISLIWFFWPTSVNIDIDSSKNKDIEKIFGNIHGKTENSQNNNSSHYNFGGHFSITILIFSLLLIQTILYSVFYYRFTRALTLIGINRSEETLDPTASTQAATVPPPHDSSPCTNSTNQLTYGQNTHSLPPVYYSAQDRHYTPPMGPPKDVTMQIANVDLKHGYYTIPDLSTPQDTAPEKQAPDIDYKIMYERLRTRSSAAGLDCSK